MQQFDPSRPDFTPYGFTCVRWVPSAMGRADHHNEIELNYITDGSVTYLLGGRKVRFEAGSLGAFWAAIPHQIVAFEPGTGYFVMTIPLTWFLQCRLPDWFTQRLLQGKVICERHVTRGRMDADLFALWQTDLEGGGEQAKDIVMLEVEARLRRLALELPNQIEAKPLRSSGKLQPGGLRKVEEMACLVARRYTESLTIGDISKAMKLHPNYAMNLFKKTFGVTLVEYLTQHRISHAQRLLATSDEKILEVALGSGFNSLSRFNEAFRKACGCSPREFRRAHQADKPGAPSEFAEGSD